MHTSKKVLIVSHSFPPLNNIAARRFGWMTSYMEEFGWTPYVLTAHSSGSLNVNIPSSRVIRIGKHYQKSAKIDEKYYKWKTDLNPVVNIVRNITKSRLLSLDASIFSWYSEVRKEYESLIDKLPDLDMIIGTYKPTASHLIAKKLSSDLNVPWIADFRDMGALRNYESNRLAKTLDLRVEKRRMKSASGITTISQTFCDALHDLHKIPTKLVYNAFFDNEQFVNNSNVDKATYKLPAEPGSYFHYAGRFRLIHLQPIKYLFKALIESGKNLHVVFRSLGPDSINEKIVEMVKEHSLEEKVKILPAVEPQKLDFEQNHAFSNLVLGDLTFNDPLGAGAIYGKFLQLLPGDVPVLSISRSDNERTAILDYTKRGMNCSTYEEILKFIELASGEKKTFNGIPERVDEYSYYSQSKRFCTFMDSLLDK